MSHLQRYLSKRELQQIDAGSAAYLGALDHVGSVFPEVEKSIIQELRDQRSHLKLIASENFSSLAVQLAMGNLMTDKYAEGYPHHRFYAGCDNVDHVEDLAVEELKKLYDCECAYVQPHSGADANLVAFLSILIHKVQDKGVEKLGKKKLEELTPEEYEALRQVMSKQTIMGLSLNSGGHLTHGFLHNISSKMFRALGYDVNPETELMDYDAINEMAQREKPLILMGGYSAHPRKVNFAKMREIADSVGAVLMVDMAHFSGLVAGKVFTGEFNPVPYAHIVTSTTHKTLRGPRGGMILCKEEFGDYVNRGCPSVLGGPLPHVMAAKAVAFKEANRPEFQDYAAKIVENARVLGERLMERGVRLVTGGTENHLLLLDIGKFGITGRQAETAFRQARLTVNRNAIPNDTNGAWYTSGIRIGTPALTTLGMGVEEVRAIADVMVDVLENTKPTIVEKTGKPSLAKSVTDEVVLEKCRGRVMELLEQYPLYPEIEIEEKALTI